jgi:hypothetical protein
LANLAHEKGLNPSKNYENALNQAIDRMQGNYSEIKSVKQTFNTKTKLVDEPGFEPGTSTMPTWRSCQTDLLAQSIWLLKVTHPRLISISYVVRGSTHKNLLMEIMGIFRILSMISVEKFTLPIELTYLVVLGEFL